MNSKPSQRRLMKLQDVAYYLLIVGIAFMLLWLAHRYDLPIDLTADNRRSLSEESIALLEQLEGPVTVTAFARDNRALRDAIRDRIGRYQQYKRDIELEFVNPDLDPERSRAENISRDGELVIRYRERREQLALLNENAISNALARMLRDQERWIVFAEGHGERQWNGQRNFDLGVFGNELAKLGFRMQSLNIAEHDIPANTSLLVIAGVQSGWLETELLRLHAWIERGGNLLWLHDPDSTSLPLLELALGVEFGARSGNGTIVDATTQLLGIDNAGYAIVSDYPQQGPTRGFAQTTLFPHATQVAARSDDWKSTPLLRTSENSWLETSALQDTARFDSEDGDIAGPITLGIGLQRPLPHTRADGIAQEQRIVVTGDGDFLSNAFLGNGGNLVLGINLVNWLMRDDDLLNIHVKPTPDRQLELGRNKQIAIALLFLVIAPLGFVLAGVLIQRRRRRR